jgi:hypothetical protein
MSLTVEMTLRIDDENYKRKKSTTQQKQNKWYCNGFLNLSIYGKTDQQNKAADKQNEISPSIAIISSIRLLTCSNKILTALLSQTIHRTKYALALFP